MCLVRRKVPAHLLGNAGQTSKSSMAIVNFGAGITSNGPLDSTAAAAGAAAAAAAVQGSGGGSGRAQSGGGGGKEKRYDDDGYYTRQEFKVFYGSHWRERWQAAAKAAPPSARPRAAAACRATPAHSLPVDKKTAEQSEEQQQQEEEEDEEELILHTKLKRCLSQLKGRPPAELATVVLQEMGIEQIELGRGNGAGLRRGRDRTKIIQNILFS